MRTPTFDIHFRGPLISVFVYSFRLQTDDNTNRWQTRETLTLGHERSRQILHDHPVIFEGGTGNHFGL